MAPSLIAHQAGGRQGVVELGFFSFSLGVARVILVELSQGSGVKPLLDFGDNLELYIFQIQLRGPLFAARYIGAL